MAKKKGKKSNQKQGEVASLPATIDPAPEIATEESPAASATTEAQQQPLAPPLEMANGGDVVEGSTSSTDQHLEVVQDGPSEDEPSVLTASSNNNETTQSIPNDHVSIVTEASNEANVAPTVDFENHLAAQGEGETLPSVVDVVHQSENMPFDAPGIVPEPITAVEMVQPNTLSDSGSQAELVETQAAKLPVSAGTQDLVAVSETPDTSHLGVEASLPVDSKESTSYSQEVTSRESIKGEPEIPLQ
jgi:hypothetical protein